MKKCSIFFISILSAVALSACGLQDEGTVSPLEPKATAMTGVGSLETNFPVTPDLISAAGAGGVLDSSGTLSGIHYEIGGKTSRSQIKERGFYLDIEGSSYVFTICQGECNTGGYKVEIADILTNEDGEWKIIVNEVSPSPTDCVTEAFTYPTCVITLSDIPTELRIENTHGIEFEGLGTNIAEETTEPTKPLDLSGVQSVRELAPYLTLTKDYLKYSECPDDSDLEFYFDLLKDKDYFIVEKDGTSYLLFLYTYMDYGIVIDRVTSIDKSYANGTLALTVNSSTRKTKNIGCEPDCSYVRCILRLDEPVDSVTMGMQAYTPYEGGFFRVGELWGASDADLNLVLPVEYRGFYRMGRYDENAPVVYRIWNGKAQGVVDAQFHEILPVKYQYVDYVSADRFIVTTQEGGVESSRLSIVDADGNSLYGSIDGILLGGADYNNYARQTIYAIARDQEPSLYGIIDDELNIILPAKYDNITVWGADTEKQFYVVEQGKENYAVFDTSGKQMTEFCHSSVYDVQTAYFEHLRDSENSENVK